MKRNLIIGLTIVVAFFFFGLSWGVWSKKRLAEKISRSAPLRVLCGENWLSTAALEDFSRAHGVRIQQWTYARPQEFLRQIANADGDLDVICVSSLLLRALERNHWIQKKNFTGLENARLVSVDFTHLPYDPQGEFGLPLFWNLYGFLGKDPLPEGETWKKMWGAKNFAFWGEELNVLYIIGRLGLDIERMMEEEPDRHTGKTVDDDLRRLTSGSVRFVQPNADPAAIDRDAAEGAWVQVPLSRVTQMLGSSSYKYELPEQGAIMELGLLAVGSKSARPELAMELINELMSTEHALASYRQLKMGTVHASLNDLEEVSAWQRPSALRKFPLNRLVFPDLNLDTLPRFQKVFDETMARQ